MAKKDEKLMMIEEEIIELDGEKCPLFKIAIKNQNVEWDTFYKTIGKYETVPFPPFKVAMVNADILLMLKMAVIDGYKLVF